MKRKFNILQILIVAATMSVSGQNFQQFLFSDNQNIIKSAVKGCLGIVRQEFQLQDPDSEKRYNLDSLDYFGYAESFFIRTQNGIIASNVLCKPWSVDDNIKNYPQYRPVMSALSIYDSSASKWVKSSIVSPSQINEIDNSDKVIVKDSLFCGVGLRVDTTLGEKDGWLLWCKRVGNDITITPIRQKLSITDSCNISHIDVADGQEYMFGVYVTADYSTAGAVQFYLSAIVEKVADEWRAIPIIYKDSLQEKEHKLVEVVGDSLPVVENPAPATPQSIKKRK